MPIQQTWLEALEVLVPMKELPLLSNCILNMYVHNHRLVLLSSTARKLTHQLTQRLITEPRVENKWLLRAQPQVAYPHQTLLQDSAWKSEIERISELEDGEESYKTLSSGHDLAIALISSVQQLLIAGYNSTRPGNALEGSTNYT